MRKFLKYPILFLLLSLGNWKKAEAQLKVKDVLKSFDLVLSQSHLKSRLTASYANDILGQDVDHLLTPFHNRTETYRWQSEFWGKWFTAAALAYRYQPSVALKKKLDAAVKGLIATQSTDGYIGNYADNARLQQWDIWGRKYCMLGLLDYYDLTKEQSSLAAAAKVADNLIDDLAKTDGIIVTKGNYRGMAASSVLEPICLLYNKTKNKKYLDFAKEIVRQWETYDGPNLISKAGADVAKRFAKPKKEWYSWEQGQKAYEMMSCYEGLLELYRITAEPSYKAAVEKTWQNIKDTEINLAGSGASAEMWFGGKTKESGSVFHYQETCVTVTWIKMSQQLLRLTGEAKYADAVEQAYYNGLFGSMGGDELQWAKYTPLVGTRKPGSGQCGMNMNCCEASGPRGLFNLPGYLVMQSDSGLQINYYAPGDYKLKSPSGKVIQLKQETTYPESGIINVQLGLVKSEVFTVSLRIPSWSKQTEILVNGLKTEVGSNGIVAIKRHWKNGDMLCVSLDMRGRIEWSGRARDFAAVLRGPILLARDIRFGNVDLTASLKPLTDKDGYLELKEVVKKDKQVWMHYTAMFMPEYYTEDGGSPIEVPLCDFASAGNGTEQSAFRVWIPQVYDPR